LKRTTRTGCLALSLVVGGIFGTGGCAVDDPEADPSPDQTERDALFVGGVDTRCPTAFTPLDRQRILQTLETSGLSSKQRITQAVNRLGFGPRLPMPLAGATASELADAILASLRRGTAVSPAVTAAVEGALPLFRQPAGTLHFRYRKLREDALAAKRADNDALASELQRQLVELGRQIVREQAGKQFMTAVLSPDLAIGEQLAYFWLNHFSVDGREVPLWANGYDQTIQLNLCGTFRGMLAASARSPAMLSFLDNALSIGRGTKDGSSGLNENYARELLELHTLGIGPKTAQNLASPYGQDDVVEAAETLTGWGFEFAPDDRSTRFQFDFAHHTLGPKTVMGKSYAEGEAGGQALLADLASNPRTKRNICTKLTGHFFASVVPNVVIDACIDAWGDGGDLPRMYMAILGHPQTWAPANHGNKIKNPLELVASAHRLASDDPATLTADRVTIALDAMKDMGMALWSFNPPTGFTGDHLRWLDAGYVNDNVRYMFAQSDPTGLSYRLPDGGVTSGAFLEKRFASWADVNLNAAFLAAQDDVLPTAYLCHSESFDKTFLRSAFTDPDRATAPDAPAPELPVRTLLSFYASSWQFLLK
jgi:uncharacterized protein (DUF1800 family)